MDHSYARTSAALNRIEWGIGWFPDRLMVFEERNSGQIMAFESGGEIVASRILQLIDEDGHRRPVSVFIGKPEPTPGPPGYSCACQIIGIGSQEPCVGHGRDSIQALKSALILVGANLRNLNAELGGRLVWEGSSPDELGLL